MEVTFIYLDTPCRDLNESNITDLYTVKKELADDDSVTDMAKEVAKDYINCNLGHVRETERDISVILFFKPVDGQDIYSTTPDYYFNERDEVIFFDFNEKIKHNWTLKELKKLKYKEHIKNDISVVYVAIPQGIGAGFLEEQIILSIKSFIFERFMGMLVSGAKSTLKSRISKIKNKDIQKIAEQWVKKQGLRSARQLRLFIINKGNWELSELAINVNITQEQAMLLLESLGFELQGNQYIPSYSEKAIQRRLEWEKRENLQLTE